MNEKFTELQAEIDKAKETLHEKHQNFISAQQACDHDWEDLGGTIMFIERCRKCGKEQFI